MDLDTVVCADALDWLRTLPDESVNCIITSPPYYGLRDYGDDGQLGLEDTPEAYVARLVAIFAEARRVLREDGTCWLNLGDSYAGSGRGPTGNSGIGNQEKRQGFHSPPVTIPDGLKPKDLIGIPWRVAFVLQADGWWLRSDIIWAKPNPMPESVRDRPTKAHEYVFLLTRAARYWYDAEAVSEQSSDNSHGGGQAHVERYMQQSGRNDGSRAMGIVTATRNRRSVWTVATEPTPFAHFATFPQKLIEPMVLAGCPARVCATCGAPWERVVERSADKVNLREGQQQQRRANGAQTGGTERVTLGVTEHVKRETIGFRPSCTCDADTRPGIVLDPFMGSGTTALVARRLGRHFLGCDVNAEYVALANERLAVPYTLPMFV